MSAPVRVLATPSWATWAPWTDKKGRFDAERATCFALLLLPAASLLVRGPLNLLGARPVNAAIHSTGYWAVVCLVLSLTVSPAKAIFGLPRIVVLRRMIGNAALAYAALHLVLYCADENWRMLTVISEIFRRFYLTIGFVALLGLIVLGGTSTDAAIRRMGVHWKRLHKLAYAITALALFHFTLQTKADVSLPLLFVGVFVWLMIWRQVPAGRDRSAAGLLLVGLAAAVVTLAAEWLWYRFGTHIDPDKVVLAEADVSFGLGPADQTLLGAVLLIAAFWLRQWSQGPIGRNPWFWALLFACGAAIDELVIFAFGIDRYLDPGDWSFLYQDFAWAALLGVLGFVHGRRRERGGTGLVDALALGCLGFQIAAWDGVMRGGAMVAAAAVAVGWALLAWRSWRETKLPALTLVPLGLLLAYGLVGLS